MNNKRTFFQYVIPSVLSFALSGVYAIVDGFFVGNSIGDAGLSTINIAYPITAVLQSVGTGIGMGGSVKYSILKAAGNEKRESKKRIDYYLEKTSLADHQKKKMRQLSGGMKRRVGLVQALLHEPDFLIVDEPTTGLDPEERIRIRNLLVDFAEERTVLFSTHVVEDLMATCNQLAVMKKGRFLYTGTMRELLNKARGHVWECCTEDESLARELERKYHISSKQYTEEGIRLRLLGENMPSESGCIACDVTLEDAYIYVTNR